MQLKGICEYVHPFENECGVLRLESSTLATLVRKTKRIEQGVVARVK